MAITPYHDLSHPFYIEVHAVDDDDDDDGDDDYGADRVDDDDIYIMVECIYLSMSQKSLFSSSHQLDC